MMRRGVRLRANTAIALAAFILIAAACGGGAQGPDAPGPTAAPAATAARATTTPAPKPESELVIYAASGPTETIFMKHLQKWAAENGGVKVTYVAGQTSASFSKIQTQARAGAVEVDVAYLNDSLAALGIAQGLFEPVNFDLVPNARQLDQKYAFPKDVVGDPPRAIRGQIVAQTLAYNTDVFKRNGWEPPTSWEDLYNPKYANCVVPLGPTSGVNYLPWLNYLNSGDYSNFTKTLENFRKIAKQVPAFPESNTQNMDLLANGAGCLTPNNLSRVIQYQQRGAPINYVLPKEGSPFQTGVFVVVKGAKHPIAAQMAVNVLVSAEASQDIMNDVWLSSTHPAVKRPASGPAATLPLAPDFERLFKEIPLSAYDKTDEWARLWSQMTSSR